MLSRNAQPESGIIFSGSPYSNLSKISCRELQVVVKLQIPPGVSCVAVKGVRGPVNDRTFVGRVTTRLKWMVAENAVLEDVHILPILGLFVIQDTPVVVTPFLENGNVMEYISSNPGARLRLILDAAHGLAYVHGKGKTHGNFNTNNILVDHNGRACLSDIGYYTIMRISTGKNHTIPVSWQYKPWEELNPTGNQPFPPASHDVYAFGSVCYEVLCGRPPYRGRDVYRAVPQIIEHGHISLPKPPEINDQIWCIIQKCWAHDANARPLMAQVVYELEQFIHLAS
jgi:serine/threonine protein kinase